MFYNLFLDYQFQTIAFSVSFCQKSHWILVEFNIISDGEVYVGTLFQKRPTSRGSESPLTQNSVKLTQFFSMICVNFFFVSYIQLRITLTKNIRYFFTNHYTSWTKKAIINIKTAHCLTLTEKKIIVTKYQFQICFHNYHRSKNTVINAFLFYD